jgi:hypothetical protein
MTNLLETPPTGPAAALPPPPTAPLPTVQAGEPSRTPMTARFLWKVFAGLLVLGALVWGPYQVVTLLAHAERTDDRSFSAAGLAKLAVDASSGSITVTAGDTASVDVHARISDGLRKTGESMRMDGDTLHLHSACPNYGSDWCHVDWDVTVPRNVAVVIESDNGHISVTGTSGVVDVNTDNGGIDLADLTGTVRASTSSGRILAERLSSSTVTAGTDNGRVSLVFVAAPTTVSVTTDNGRAEVVVPADGSKYRVHATSDNGSRSVTIPEDSSSTRSINVRTDNGGITLRTTAG